jgi:hypothetical protein
LQECARSRGRNFHLKHADAGARHVRARYDRLGDAAQIRAWLEARGGAPRHAALASSRIIAAAFSPIMMLGALVLSTTTDGMIDASATRRQPIPAHQHRTLAAYSRTGLPPAASFGNSPVSSATPRSTCGSAPSASWRRALMLGVGSSYRGPHKARAHMQQRTDRRSPASHYSAAAEAFWPS